MRAHRAIASRSFSRSADEVGALKNGMVTPPLPVSVGLVTSSTCSPVCMESYSRAVIRIGLRNAGWVVTSLTRSPCS